MRGRMVGPLETPQRRRPWGSRVPARTAVDGRRGRQKSRSWQQTREHRVPRNSWDHGVTAAVVLATSQKKTAVWRPMGGAQVVGGGVQPGAVITPACRGGVKKSQGTTPAGDGGAATCGDGGVRRRRRGRRPLARAVPDSWAAPARCDLPAPLAPTPTTAKTVHPQAPPSRRPHGPEQGGVGAGGGAGDHRAERVSGRGGGFERTRDRAGPVVEEIGRDLSGTTS